MVWVISFESLISSEISSKLSEETAYSTVYQYLSQQSSRIKTAQNSLRWRLTVGWAVSSESAQ